MADARLEEGHKKASSVLPIPTLEFPGDTATQCTQWVNHRAFRNNPNSVPLCGVERSVVQMELEELPTVPTKVPRNGSADPAIIRRGLYFTLHCFIKDSLAMLYYLLPFLRACIFTEFLNRHVRCQRPVASGGTATLASSCSAEMYEHVWPLRCGHFGCM